MIHDTLNMNYCFQLNCFYDYYFSCVCCHKQGYICFVFEMFYKHNTIRKLIEIYDLCFASKVEKEEEKNPLTAEKMLNQQKYLIIIHLRCWRFIFTAKLFANWIRNEFPVNIKCQKLRKVSISIYRLTECNGDWKR